MWDFRRNSFEDSGIFSRSCKDLWQTVPLQHDSQCHCNMTDSATAIWQTVPLQHDSQCHHCNMTDSATATWQKVPLQHDSQCHHCNMTDSATATWQTVPQQHDRQCHCNMTDSATSTQPQNRVCQWRGILSLLVQIRGSGWKLCAKLGHGIKPSSFTGQSGRNGEKMFTKKKIRGIRIGAFHVL